VFQVCDEGEKHEETCNDRREIDAEREGVQSMPECPCCGVPDGARHWEWCIEYGREIREDNARRMASYGEAKVPYVCKSSATLEPPIKSKR